MSLVQALFFFFSFYACFLGSIKLFLQLAPSAFYDKSFETRARCPVSSVCPTTSEGWLYWGHAHSFPEYPGVQPDASQPSPVLSWAFTAVWSVWKTLHTQTYLIFVTGWGKYFHIWMKRLQRMSIFAFKRRHWCWEVWFQKFPRVLWAIALDSLVGVLKISL